MRAYLGPFYTVVALTMACTHSQAVVHTDKDILVFHSPDARDCTFFQLSGVSEADPVAPGGTWFAVPKTHSGYKEIVATLLLARAAGRRLNHVSTSGAIACGHAEVLSVSM